MSNRKTTNIDDILNSLSFVDDAVKNMNFSSLDQDMRNSIKSVFDELNIRTEKTKTRDDSNVVYHKAARPEIKTPPRFLKKPNGRGAAVFCKIAGIAGTALFGISTLASLITGIVSGSMGMFITPAIVLIISIVLMVHGIQTTSFNERFESYKQVIGSRNYCDIAELAARVGKSKKFVVDDLYKMISKKYFYNAHIDKQGTSLMLNEDVYKQYLESEQSYQERLKSERADLERFQRQTSIYGTTSDTELTKAIAEGEQYLNAIRRANDLVPDVVITEKLHRLENVIERIFIVLSQKPDQLPKLRKFMKYYMPTTLKLVQTYQELDSQSVVGDNITKSKKEIEGTLDTINSAYEKLLDSFFEEDAIDVSSDISVLQTMLAQEGLTEDQF